MMLRMLNYALAALLTLAVNFVLSFFFTTSTFEVAVVFCLLLISEILCDIYKAIERNGK